MLAAQRTERHLVIHFHTFPRRCGAHAIMYFMRMGIIMYAVESANRLSLCRMQSNEMSMNYESWLMCVASGTAFGEPPSTQGDGHCCQSEEERQHHADMRTC